MRILHPNDLASYLITQFPPLKDFIKLRLDDLLHFLFECCYIRPFWGSLASWMDRKPEIADFPQDLSEEDFMLGINDNVADLSLVNYIIMWAKSFVFKNSTFGDGDFDFFQFLLELKNRMNIEKLACFEQLYNIASLDFHFIPHYIEARPL